MESHLGTNLITWLVIFPVLLIVAGVIIWYLTKIKGSLVKKVTMIMAGFFAFIGFAVILLGVYYHLNPAFASGFKFYTYSTLAPEGNPFEISEGDYTPVLIQNEVYKEDGQIKFLSNLKPDLPYYVALFSSGKYIYTKVDNGVLTIPADTPGLEPSVTKTSLWWALTKDLYKYVDTVK
ncbi:MAG: hypothetical protein U5L76_04660 [Patescibacteria group bacterium]|nr:hypothetical protein [Patescibacteria group bacterium]